MKKFNFNKILSLTLALMMVLTMFPLGNLNKAFAATNFPSTINLSKNSDFQIGDILTVNVKQDSNGTTVTSSASSGFTLSNNTVLQVNGGNFEVIGYGAVNISYFLENYNKTQTWSASKKIYVYPEVPVTDMNTNIPDNLIEVDISDTSKNTIQFNQQ